ncbi:YtnP family quorum-quenching lactonase [Texcoconibacillus texcoconensis]|uniref:YtnP family quorum-quenching lactonase n=1 Tax=Texcoconibacillus texcoconensis TaxID=1095777 RepID=UPI00161CE829|nr:MBL fold metallo-hydrolase [Texcoconibacillus texcoconensis]
MEQFQRGDMTFTWLNGGVTHMDGGAMFGVVPKPLWSKKYPCNEQNQVELRTDPILLQVEGRNILIDTGIGNRKFTDKQMRNFGIFEEAKLEESLQHLGLTCRDIDTVLMTHMHFDHASGLARYNEVGELVPTFENATVIVQETEWEELLHPNIRSRSTYFEMNWKPIRHQVETYEDVYEVVEGIRLIHTGGHSAGHAILKIDRKGEHIVHMADLMPTHAHQNALWVLAFDDYPMDSIAMKQEHLLPAIKQNAWFLFYHDYKYRALKLDENGSVIGSLERQRK